MALNYIYIGSITEPSFFFSNETITELNANISIDAVGNELAIDTLEFTVSYYDDDNLLRSLVYGTPIFYYDSENFVGKFYFKNVSRVGEHNYRIYSVSVIGLMEFEKHYGGYYQNKRLRDAIEETFISNGLKTNLFKEYIKVSSGASDFALAENYLGSSSYTSGSNTGIYIAFTIDELPSSGTAIIYYMSARDDTAGMSNYYNVDVEVSTSGYCNVACMIGSSPVYNRFGIYPHDFVEVTIRPDIGRITCKRTGGGASEQVFTVDPIPNYNVILPLYVIGGIYYRKYSDGQVNVTDSFTSQLPYKLHCLKFFNVEASGEVVHFELHGMQNYFTGASFARDIVSGQTFYGDSHYISGGETIDFDDFADVITENEINSELANIARNIQWDNSIANLTFSGWIPSGTKRAVLHQILFALNLNLYKDANGNLIIGKLPDDIADTIVADDIYNEGSVENVKQPKRIELTEHYYGSPSSGSEQVFDNSSGTTPSGTYIVDLNNAPVYGNVTGSSGMSVIINNANAAIVRGKGKLYAQAYDHSKRVITANISTRPDGDTVSVSNATLVTYINSTAVMDKLKAYYANNAYIINDAIVGNGRKTGRRFLLQSPFREPADAYLLSARITGSVVTKYDCKFVAGYTPVKAGNTYNNFVLLTGSGTWQVPDGVTRIYAVIVGGGQGGTSGLAGQDGKRIDGGQFKTLPAPKGGAYGANGSGGKVFTIAISNPSASYAYNCGVGGSGGVICANKETGNVGSLGGNTTFGSYSSASGEVVAAGYTNIVNGDVLARSMPTWNSESGKGGDGGYVTVGKDKIYEESVQNPAEEVYNFLTGEYFRGGRSGRLGAWGSINGIDTDSTRKLNRVGGGGGGGALNMAGSAATKGSPSITDVTRRDELFVGGNGANATYVPPKATDYNPKYYGYGGMGGAGGGGGGNGGAYEDTWSSSEKLFVSYHGGVGGYGGRGGDGGDGCVLVYY